MVLATWALIWQRSAHTFTGQNSFVITIEIPTCTCAETVSCTALFTINFKDNQSFYSQVPVYTHIRNHIVVTKITYINIHNHGGMGLKPTNVCVYIYVYILSQIITGIKLIFSPNLWPFTKPRRLLLKEITSCKSGYFLPNQLFKISPIYEMGRLL